MSPCRWLRRSRYAARRLPHRQTDGSVDGRSRPGPRRRHDLDPGDGVRPAGSAAGCAQAELTPALSAARLGRARRAARSGGRRSPARARWSSRPAARSGSPRSASPTSARPWSPGTGDAASRSPARSSGRTGAPPISAPTLREAGHEAAVQRARPGCCSIPISRPPRCAGCSTTSRQVRATRREAGRLAFGTVESWLVCKLTGGAPVRRRATPAARCCSRSTGAQLGRRAVRPVRRAARRRCPRWSTAPARSAQTDAVRRADPDLRARRRPAGGDDRPGLPRARRHQGDLRHRRVRARQHGRGACRARDHRLLGTVLHQLGGERTLRARRLGVRRRQPGQMAARFARLDRDRRRDRGARRARCPTAAGW